MSKIIVENLDARQYTASYRVQTKGKDGKIGTSVQRVNFPANQTVSIDKDIWDAVLNTANGVNTINNKLSQGRLLVVGGGKLSEENRNAASMREVTYTQFTNIAKQMHDAGGKENKEMAPHLRKDGAPTFKMIRKNMGDAVDGDTYNAFAARFAKERSNGMHQTGLKLPGAKSNPPSGEVVDNKKDGDGMPDNPYDAIVDKFVELLPDMIERDEIGKKGPKQGYLKANGLEISADERDHAWSLLQEQRPDLFEQDDEEGEED